MRRNAAFSVAVQLSGALFTAALTLYLVRALGPHEYGLFALALAVGELLLLPSDLGISPAAARFVAERRTERAAAATILDRAIVLKLGVVAAVSTALFASADAIAAAYDAPDLAWPLRLIALALFGQNLVLLYGASLAALGRLSVQLRIVVSESAAELLASVVIVSLGAGATGAAVGRAAGYTVGGLIGLVLLARLLGRRISLRPRRSEQAAVSLPGIRQIAKYGGVLLIADGALTLFSQLDILLIGIVLDAEESGLFQAPMRLVTFLGYPGLAVGIAVAPGVARRLRGTPEFAQLLLAARYVLLFGAAVAAVLVAWSVPLTTLVLGPSYADSADVLRALAPYALMLNVVPLFALALNYLGEARRRIPLILAAVLVNLVFDLIMLPRIGIVAGAIGTNLGFLVFAIGLVWIYRRQTAAAIGPLAGTLARAALAAAALGGVLAAWGTTDLSPLQWIGGAVSGLLAFLAVLRATGERLELRRS